MSNCLANTVLFCEQNIIRSLLAMKRCVDEEDMTKKIQPAVIKEDTKYIDKSIHGYIQHIYLPW